MQHDAPGPTQRRRPAPRCATCAAIRLAGPGRRRRPASPSRSPACRAISRSATGSPCGSRDGRDVPAEIVGFRGGVAQAMPFGAADGLGPARAPGRPAAPAAPRRRGAGGLGCLARPRHRPARPPAGRARPAAAPAASPRRCAPPPPPATQRARLGPPLDLGVRVLNCFATCRTRPAPRPVRRLRRRQIHPAGHAGPPHRLRRGRARPGRRTRPRGARVRRGRSRRRTAWRAPSSSSPPPTRRR